MGFASTFSLEVFAAEVAGGKSMAEYLVLVKQWMVIKLLAAFLAPLDGPFDTSISCGSGEIVGIRSSRHGCRIDLLSGREYCTAQTNKKRDKEGMGAWKRLKAMFVDGRRFVVIWS